MQQKFLKREEYTREIWAHNLLMLSDAVGKFNL
jgi:hypothetical protein